MKLGQQTTDKVTKLRVTPTLLQVESSNNAHRLVLVQPYGLNPETRQPKNDYWTTEENLGAKIDDNLPYHLIGKKAVDSASGFNGTIVSLQLFINGCIHAHLQPEGTQKNGEKIANAPFDIRRLKGKEIKQFTDEELEKSIKENPSPILYNKYAPTVAKHLKSR